MTQPMRASISTYALSDLPLEEAIDRLIQEGWRSIEIMAEGPHGELLGWTKEKVDDLRRMGKQHGISFSIHAPIKDCNPAAARPDVIRAAAETVLHTLHLAEELGCIYIVLHPGELAGGSSAQPGRSLEDETLERVITFLQVILQASEDSKVIIALENVPPYPGLLGTEPGFLERIVQRLASPRIRLIYDCGHAHLHGDGACLSMLRAMLPYLVGLHLSDNLGLQDDHLALGTGTVPVEAVLALLQDSGFTGSSVLEVRDYAAVEASLPLLLHPFANRVAYRNQSNPYDQMHGEEHDMIQTKHENHRNK
ncbi:sugar phosphate isomerase [Paenibacillus sp. CAA11]|uniref:sugar phosphate isomerase/epimerase family protein n=1 Tax=Paenibacillus sp. CAA11 TaxID=1532905 RepID=UPI000D38BE83|nr:sugar phosphate isomerase/epimerase family protein [Paenibacillus sp. CAA11]AWB43054.1 sugar phosphate isomerase [Paenibacillus sp. CAA11]